MFWPRGLLWLFGVLAEGGAVGPQGCGSPKRGGGCNPTRSGPREGTSGLGNPAGRAQEGVCPAAVTPRVAAWTAFSAQVDATATRARGAPVSARDVGRLSLVGSASRFALFRGAGEGPRAGEEQIVRGEGGAAQSLGVGAQAHSREPAAATTLLIRAPAPRQRQLWPYRGHGFFASP